MLWIGCCKESYEASLFLQLYLNTKGLAIRPFPYLLGWRKIKSKYLAIPGKQWVLKKYHRHLLWWPALLTPNPEERANTEIVGFVFSVCNSYDNYTISIVLPFSFLKWFKVCRRVVRIAQKIIQYILHSDSPIFKHFTSLSVSLLLHTHSHKLFFFDNHTSLSKCFDMFLLRTKTFSNPGSI